MTEEVHQNPKPAPRRPRWGTITVWVALFAILGLVGVSLVRSQRGPIGVGAQVPQFNLQTFDGESITVADLRGHVTVVNFWASWCQPCEEEAFQLEQAYQEFKDQGVQFLGVSYVDSQPEALAYLSRFGVTYPNGPDLGTRISQAFRIRGVPETYIISPTGILVDVRIGPFASLAEIEAVIRAALRQSE